MHYKFVCSCMHEPWELLNCLLAQPWIAHKPFAYITKCTHHRDEEERGK